MLTIPHTYQNLGFRMITLTGTGIRRLMESPVSAQLLRKKAVTKPPANVASHTSVPWIKNRSEDNSPRSRHSLTHLAPQISLIPYCVPNASFNTHCSRANISCLTCLATRLELRQWSRVRKGGQGLNRGFLHRRKGLQFHTVMGGKPLHLQKCTAHDLA